MGPHALVEQTALSQEFALSGPVVWAAVTVLSYSCELVCVAQEPTPSWEMTANSPYVNTPCSLRWACTLCDKARIQFSVQTDQIRHSKA